MSTFLCHSIYIGKKPNISITDLELISIITVKEFGNFPDKFVRKTLLNFSMLLWSFYQDLPDIMDFPKGLVVATGEDWKRARQILSPTFSSFKLKAVCISMHALHTIHDYPSFMKMTPHVIQSVDSLVEVFQQCANEGKSTEIKRSKPSCMRHLGGNICGSSVRPNKFPVSHQRRATCTHFNGSVGVGVVVCKYTLQWVCGCWGGVCL